MVLKIYPRLMLGLVMSLVVFVLRPTVFAEGTAPSGSDSTPTEITTPIELPPEHEAMCKSEKAGATHQNCLAARHILSLVSAEPRNKGWATGMEAYLQGWIDSQTSQGISATNIECRLSWCVVEVRSSEGHDLLLNLVEARKVKLFQRLDLFAPVVSGFEPNAKNILIIFKRFGESTKDLIDVNGHLIPTFDTVGKHC